MTGITAEKHEAFLEPKNGRPILKFSGSALVRGEPDASSFPSGGLRATFEARGYTAWDPTSCAFIKGNCLCIPTAFCSFGGEALDMKTPLLRSMEVIDRQAMRVLKLFGNSTASQVITTVGVEQEYFLIDEKYYQTRPDLINCSRTLIGAKPPKGQELEDHYFGMIKPRVTSFMADLDEELWKLGIYAKTEHNEVAPSQHELAPVFSISNVAADQNQLVMEMMTRIAMKHGMRCLLHEKPFAGVNGSGKHNNWGMATNDGINLLEPGDTPQDNAQFLLFLAAIIQAVDLHQDLMRFSVANAANDHRLGANEAPPAILSIFVGDELDGIINSIINNTTSACNGKTQMSIGVTCLPHILKDTTDRNRTSPFAFTGNKFEFRMPGSSQSVAMPNIILNTIVADSLRQFADELENSPDMMAGVRNLTQKVFTEHRRIIFNGNNYAGEWVTEAARRGLQNLKATPDVLPCLTEADNIALFERSGVFSASELHSRAEVCTENYCKVISIEALTLIDMVKRDIIPAVLACQRDLSATAAGKASLKLSLNVELEACMLTQIASLSAQLLYMLQDLEQHMAVEKEFASLQDHAVYQHEVVFADMVKLREVIDQIEPLCGKKCWPYPSYAAMLLAN
ncbi:MAG TPA: glutamine synthetase type III [Clostridiales bacterium]|nr:glutamine synthetase type III [Clostridiales bacterium]